MLQQHSSLVGTRRESDVEYAAFGDSSSSYLFKNTGQAGGKARLDLNVEKAWALGFTGKNITTAIMDDGVDYMHPDIRNNFNAEASYDFSSNDPYPYPRYTDDWFNSHGTRCAGEIAAARDNGVCGVGVAYDSKVAGIRMLDQPYMTDLIEANSMGHEPNKIHIYSASWGPTDDGKTVDGPRNATMRAIVKGVNEVRLTLCGPLPVLFFYLSLDFLKRRAKSRNWSRYNGSVWKMHSISFWYFCCCSRSCWGICPCLGSKSKAYLVQLNNIDIKIKLFPILYDILFFRRDLQHLTVLTSTRNSLFDGRCRDLPELGLSTADNHKKSTGNCTHFEWQMNGVGLEYNHLFGFGVLDAAEMVMLAMVWKTAPPRYHCTGGTIDSAHEIPEDGNLVLELDTDACVGTATEVRYLEHVQAVVSFNSSRRGDTTLYLVSPMGTRTMILSRRPKDDDAKDGFTNWPFMTTHTWGENPNGNKIAKRINQLNVCGKRNIDNNTDYVRNEVNIFRLIYNIFHYIFAQYSRLALLQGTAFAYVPSVQAYVGLNKCNYTENDIVPDSAYYSKLATLQGCLIASSFVPMIIGSTGLVGLFTKFIGPLTVSPLMLLLAFSQVGLMVDRISKHWVAVVCVENN
uniref:Neuroendocrine convertase 2 n=1 Tax=Heterorhabditis bacteriophora TaxID=37862 RepID=A0A1I7XFR8_HETBA